MSTAIDDQWTRDVSRMIVGWLIATAIAIALMLTVVKWYFLGSF
ncbi:MAG: hypothetical protein ABEH78_08455 [Haloferacaceae archaeon]